MTPQTETELAAFIAEAKTPLRLCGGDTRGGSGGTSLSTRALDGITLYEPGALTLVARAGTAVEEIDAELAKNGQRLAFEPMDQRGLLGTKGVPTIGGVVAGNISGPRRIQAGACRDFLLGVQYVDGLGRMLKNGGRVMKNVTGYDLARLLSGSWGQLGVLTEVSLKVLPAPESQACLLIDGLSDTDAVAAMSKALGSPFDVTGAAHIPVGLSGAPVTMLRIEGFKGSVAYRLTQLERLFANHATRKETDPQQVTKGWSWVRDAAPLHGANGDIWRVSCKPTEAPELAAKLEARQHFFDWGGGLIWAEMPAGTDARAALGEFDGHATLVKGDTAQNPKFHPQSAAVQTLSNGIKAKFDPKGLFQTGWIT